MSNNQDIYEFSLASAIRKRWWIVVGAIGLVVVLSWAMQMREKTSFEATSLLALRSRTAPNPYVNQEMAQAYLSNDSVLAELSKTVKRGWTPGRIVSAFRVIQVGDFVKITATAADPKEAVVLSNTLGETLYERASRSAKNKEKAAKKRMSEIMSSVKTIEKTLGKQQEGIEAVLNEKGLTSAEKNMLLAWNTQLYSLQEDRKHRLLKERMDIKLQLGTIMDSVPIFSASRDGFANKSAGGRRVLAGLVAGTVIGLMAASWLELRQKRSLA